MPKYFMINTHLRESEREMMKVPNFEEIPRKNHELIVSADCKDCAYQTLSISQRICDKISCEKCPFLTERLLAGDADRLVSLQQARFDEVILSRSIFFDIPQKGWFHALCGSIDYGRKNPREMAVLYLLSSEESLFDRCVGNTPEELLRNLDTKGLFVDAYNILCIAKDILLHTSYTSAEDYANVEIISHRVIGLVFCTLLILRYGFCEKLTSPQININSKNERNKTL